MSEKNKSVFISYSHNDSNYVDRLRIHLKPIEKKYNILIWDDSKLEPGDKWRETVIENLERASVVLLVVSPDFLASEFVMEFEYPKALKNAEEKGTKILMLIAGPCLLDEFEISDIQAINSPENTLQDLETNGAEQERVFVSCAKAIKRYLEH